MATAAPNQRASLLSGLRTGGVRSASIPVPHTAAPGATFNTSRYAPALYGSSAIGEEDEGELADMVSQKMYFNTPPRMQQAPMTAAVDGSYNRFAQQQSMHAGLATAGSNHMSYQAQAQQQQQQQALQIQMMQLEMLRLQALQAQQYQAELLAQAQLQQQQQARSYQAPATAGPLAVSFGSAQLRRPSHADALRHQLGLASHDEQVPMTAALSGKFGGRLQISADDLPSTRGYQSPMTPTSYTNVISGGTSLGSGNSTPSKSDSAASWRRASTNHSVLRRSPPPVMPDVKVTPPPLDVDAPPMQGPQSAVTPSTATPTGRARPSPLNFAPAVPLPATVAVDDSTDGDDASSETSSAKSGSASGSSPATPQSGINFAPPLSPREEATKKLYEGLGLGRPEKLAPSQLPAVMVTAAVPRVTSQAVRQPRGPPSGADELGPRNFATRIRKRAIGGLGALIGARISREPTPTPVEAY